MSYNTRNTRKPTGTTYQNVQSMRTAVQQQSGQFQSAPPKPLMQQQQQQQPQQQQQQQQPPQQQQQQRPQQPLPQRKPQQQQQYQQQQQQQQQKQAPPPPIIKLKTEAPVTEIPFLSPPPSFPILETPKTNEEMDTDGSESKKKILTFKANKISKKDKRLRRNQRLRKILQPKNALMVLNELVSGAKYDFLEKGSNNRMNVDPTSFGSSVVVDGKEFFGYGRNKNAAKTSAAEAALKHVILGKLSNTINKQQQQPSEDGKEDDEGDIKMEMEENNGTSSSEDDDVSWIHIASYAMYKLFNGWDEEGDARSVIHAVTNAGAAMPGATSATIQAVMQSASAQNTKRPARQMPPNANLMNPVMLVNQMRPETVFEDVAKEMNPPNSVFTVRATVDGVEFFGKGTSKKMARKNCAYELCKKSFGINYPNDEPINNQ